MVTTEIPLVNSQVGSSPTYRSRSFKFQAATDYPSPCPQIPSLHTTGKRTSDSDPSACCPYPKGGPELLVSALQKTSKQKPEHVAWKCVAKTVAGLSLLPLPLLQPTRLPRSPELRRLCPPWWLPQAWGGLSQTAQATILTPAITF